MSKILVNAVGDACPIPVTKTIHALVSIFTFTVSASPAQQHDFFSMHNLPNFTFLRYHVFFSDLPHRHLPI